VASIVIGSDPCRSNPVLWLYRIAAGEAVRAEIANGRRGRFGVYLHTNAVSPGSSGRGLLKERSSMASPIVRDCALLSGRSSARLSKAQCGSAQMGEAKRTMTLRS